MQQLTIEIEIVHTMSYEIIQQLGKGAFGDVALGRDKSPPHELVAIKVIDLESASSPIEDIQKEIQVLAELCCPQVVQYKGAYMQANNLHIVMELLDAGTLYDLISDEETGGPLPGAAVAVCAREVVTGIAYLHANNMIHRDIKADNILLSMDGSIKIGDFGETGRITNTMDKRNTVVGSPYWMAPEVITESNYDFSADIWSLGITMMELSMGEPPLMHIHPMRVLFLIPKNPPPTLEVEGCSKAAKDFVSACLKKHPSERPSAPNLLKHKFITGAKKGLSSMAALIQERRSGKKKLGSDIKGNGVGEESKKVDGGGTVLLSHGEGAEDFAEDSDQGEGLASNSGQESEDSGSDSSGDDDDDDDDDDWDFESRKFSAAELKEALAKQSSLARQLDMSKTGTLSQEIEQVGAGIDAVMSGIDAASSGDKRNNVATVPIAPVANILPTASLLPKEAFVEDRSKDDTIKDENTTLLPIPSLIPKEEYASAGSGAKDRTGNVKLTSRRAGSGVDNGNDLDVGIFDTVVQPAMDSLLSQMSQSNLYFGDVTAALAQLRLAFNQLDACSPQKGAVTNELMARIFCEASRSPFSSVRELYDNPYVRPLANGISEHSTVDTSSSNSAAAADVVSRALMQRLQEQSNYL